MVEGQQTGRLGDPPGGHLGAGVAWGAGGAAGPSGGPSRVAGASGVVTGMRGGWVVVFSKSEEQPRSTKLAGTEGDVAGSMRSRHALWVWRGRGGGGGRRGLSASA